MQHFSFPPPLLPITQNHLPHTSLSITPLSITPRPSIHHPSIRLPSSKTSCPNSPDYRPSTQFSSLATAALTDTRPSLKTSGNRGLAPPMDNTLSNPYDSTKAHYDSIHYPWAQRPYTVSNVPSLPQWGMSFQAIKTGSGILGLC